MHTIDIIINISAINNVVKIGALGPNSACPFAHVEGNKLMR